MPGSIVSQTYHKVKLLPALWLAASRRRLDRLLRLWCIMRALDRQGQGWVYLADLQAAVKSWHIGGLGDLRHILLAGKDGSVFWQRSGDVICYRSLWRVGKSLADGNNPFIGRPIYLALGDLQSLRAFRAALYSAALAQRGQKPISRQTLGRLTARTRTTLRNYEKCRKVRAVDNIAELARRPANAASLDELRRLRAEAVVDGRRDIGILRDGADLLLARILPNSYQVDGVAFASFGMLYHLRRDYRGLLQTRPNDSFAAKRYYMTPAAAARRRKSETGFLFSGSLRDRVNVQTWAALPCLT